MCGIAGLLLHPAGRVPADQVRSLLRVLEHRGPDDHGWLAFSDRGTQVGREVPGDLAASAVLIHRRLSILDLSVAGWQPMGTPDGRHFLIFNGEIYNYIELRAELEALGQRFHSNSDTEVLLAGFVRWGPRVLERLVGMFAFAILDTVDRKLFLARDFVGIKPMYYARWRDGFAFASEINALLDLPGVTRKINPQRLYDFLRFGLTDIAGETLLQDIKQLPAAHYLEVPLDGFESLEPVRWWQVELDARSDLSFDQAAAHTRELFFESVRFHLRSDVPLGTALSGGVDSSAIVMTMRQVEPSLEIHAFGYAADDPAVNEEKWMQIVADASGAVLHKVRADPHTLVSELAALINTQGECFGGTSIYAQRQIFRTAKEAGIKVMLDGQGADELLAGYQYYVAARFGSLLRQGAWGEAAALIRSASRRPGLSGIGILTRSMDFLLPSAMQLPLRRWVRKDLDPAWMDFRWFSRHGIVPRSIGYQRGKDVLRQALYTEMTENSLPRLLRFEDRNSMAFSIESRVPFLTPKLVQFLFTLPERYLIAPDGTTKAVFRKAMRGVVPDAILDRKDKIGFATPEKDWLLALRPWVDGILEGDTAARIRAIDSKEVRREWGRIVRGERTFDARVWRWISTVLWAQRFEVSFD